MDCIGRYEYSSKELIGHGAFAVVYKGRLKGRPNDVVAIKAITKKNLAKSQNLLGKEIKILKELTELHHDNVVALLDCMETTNHVYLVMEYCNGGDLADYLNAKGTLSEDTIRLFLRQLAGAMSAMVSKDIVHRDLKPQNILLSHDGRTKNPLPQDIKLKIADFGFARFLQDGVMAATLCGSPMYMAPEVIMSLQYNSKADLWSLGTIVFQCLTGKAPFQAQTPQALKHFYEKNSRLAPKIPAGTSPHLTDLLIGLLKRDSRDRLEFDVFFNHPFLRSREPEKKSEPSKPVSVPSPEPPKPCRRSAPSSPVLPPSPVAMAPGSPRFHNPVPVPVKREETKSDAKGSGSSPEDDFVMVPDHLTMDSADIRKQFRKPSPALGRRHTVGSRPAQNYQPDPIPVPAQKANYQQMQQCMVRSRSRSGDSVMSGVSSASERSTLGPLPEERATSPVSKTPDKTRRTSAPMIPDICKLSPPPLQYTLGNAPPGHRRRTSSSSSCGTPPPGAVPPWPLQPSNLSPVRSGAGRTLSGPGPNLPCLSPILGSPNKGADNNCTAVMQWESGQNPARALTVPENLSAYQQQNDGGVKRRSVELLQYPGGRNIVLNYGQQQQQGLFERSGSLTSFFGRQSGKENHYPLTEFMLQPPPALSEETLLAPEHNETLAKLRFVSQYVDTIIDVARCKAAPLSVSSGRQIQIGDFDPNSQLHRRVQQLLLYMRCLHLLSQALEFSRTELKSKKLKPSTSVKNVLATMNERFRHCISMTKMLNSENLLSECGLDGQSSAELADRILYQYAIEQCQSAALDELFGNPGECFQRYHGAHILLHALENHAKTSEEKSTMTKYRDAVEKRLGILSEQGFVTAYETNIQ